MENKIILGNDSDMPTKDLDPSSYVAIGRRLRNLRRAWTLTQAEMAEKIGMTSSRWANYEVGTSRIPPEEAMKLVKLYEVRLDWIYWGSRAMMPPDLLEKMDKLEAERAIGRPRTKTRP